MTKPSRSLNDVKRMFGTEAACKEHLARMRFPNGKAVCPRCGATERVYALKTRPYHWVCKNVSPECPGVYRFSLLTGTVFENTNVPLTIWFEVLYLMTQSKKGISALQVHRMIDPVRGKVGSYRTAWYMCHRIRAAMKEDGGGILNGIVEIDETYVGGSADNAHRGNRGKTTSARVGKRGNLVPPKVGVVGAIARKGNVVCKVIGSADAPSIKAFIRKTVGDDVSLIATDAHPAYEKLVDAGYTHESVNHRGGEYVRGIVHTANLDSFWSLIKRGIMGSFHHVSGEYLPLYLNEFSYRHNNRDNPDMFDDVLARC
ncbi:MAG TPA: IS1595 family transposase [Candidatus Binatia bacterium]|nr:IS1595 family transposase [Candidatus Binatia bacterium]